MKRLLGLGLLSFFLSSAGAEAQAPSGQLRSTVTGYCHEGRMYSGQWTHVGAVAVDRSVIPLYSFLTIEGLPGTYQALDTGGGVQGAWVDVFFASCEEAMNWGRRTHLVSWWQGTREPAPVREPEPGAEEEPEEPA